jgi:lipopolysaccharide transport system ATP-binding protein
MSDVAIRVEGLGKLYRLGKRERYRTLRDTLVDTFAAPFRRLRSGASSNGQPETIWALKDVSFDVKPGEVVGIIGRNGAGKSTLLKILSRITEPTEGCAEIHGRVSSLLEVGTGFHPELTGRDNIYLNGAILGMHKAEIAKKFDEIVAFAEIEKFLDTPVKHYSSGMYVRLAFAVAAHLEPDILVVDEVLAVGDVQFQKKCLNKMDDVSKGGRTVLFVSHNMSAIAQLTARAILLHAGGLSLDGPTDAVIERYTEASSGQEQTFFDVEHKVRTYQGTGAARIVAVWFDRPVPLFGADENIEFVVRLRAEETVPTLRVSMTVFAQGGIPVGSCFGPEIPGPRGGEMCEVKVTLPSPLLAPGRYFCGMAIGKGDHTSGHVDFDVVLNVLPFEVAPEEGDGGTVSFWTPAWGPIRFQPLQTIFSRQDGAQHARI